MRTKVNLYSDDVEKFKFSGQNSSFETIASATKTLSHDKRKREPGQNCKYLRSLPGKCHLCWILSLSVCKNSSVDQGKKTGTTGLSFPSFFSVYWFFILTFTHNLVSPCEVINFPQIGSENRPIFHKVAAIIFSGKKGRSFPILYGFPFSPFARRAPCPFAQFSVPKPQPQKGCLLQLFLLLAS